MDKHTEIIFNLFIMEFTADYYSLGRSEIDKSKYNWTLKESNMFRLAKSCFPENETCEPFLIDGTKCNAYPKSY